MTTRKFMQTLDNKHYVELEVLAKKRGITLQQFLRAVVVPEWMDVTAIEGKPEKSKGLRSRSRRLHRRVTPILTVSR